MSSPCYICGTGMQDVKIDPRDMKTKPCTKCEQIIQETVGGRGDQEESMTWGELAHLIYNEDGEVTDGETGVGDPEGRRTDSVHGAGVEPERVYGRPK